MGVSDSWVYYSSLLGEKMEKDLKWTRQPKCALVTRERIEITTAPHPDLWRWT